MIIKTFLQLTESEKNLLYETLSQKKMFQHSFDMFLYMTHPHFRFGSETYICFAQEKVTGVMSVISKHTTKTGELCIPLFYFYPNAKGGLRSFLHSIWDLYADLSPKYMKIGVQPEHTFTLDLLLQEGIQPIDRALVFVKSLPNPFVTNMDEQLMEIVPLHPKDHNQEDHDRFVSIYNEAFQEDPHVHPIDQTHLDEIFNAIDHQRQIGFVQQDGKQIGVYEIEWRETDEGNKLGWIETIALVPSARGRGIGNHLLQKLMAILANEGAQSISLRTYENNASAVALYEKNGFKLQSIHSIWHMYEREMEKTLPKSRSVRRRGKNYRMHQR